MRHENYLMEKMAKSQPRRTAMTDAFIEAAERREAKDKEKRERLQRRERRQDKRNAPQSEEAEA
jgi:hypothetical protein